MNCLNKLFAWFRRKNESERSKETEKQSHLDLQEKVEKRVLEKEHAEELQKAIDQARTWRNRALMAREQRNEDLVKQALARMWQYQVAAARLLGKEPPPEPDDIPPGDEDLGLDEQSGLDRPWRPFDPSRVPRKPLPSSGGSEVALPLPEKDEGG